MREQILESVNHKFDEQISEITENLESKIKNVNEQMADQIQVRVKEQYVEIESKCISKIKESNDDIKNKIMEVENVCKQSIQESVGVMNKHNLQYKNKYDNKFRVIEQDIIEIKDELHVAVSQNLNNVAERILYTREAKDDIELEQFCCDNRRVHPMQFLSRVREFNRFNSSSWEVKLLKILKCFKGSSEIWAEVHRTEWGSYENFEAAFRNKYWSDEDQEISVSYTHLHLEGRDGCLE